MSTDVMRLSPSTAKILLRRSPLHAWSAHRLGGGIKSEDTEAKTRGRLLDKMLLGVGPEIVVIDAKDWRTNAAKEARDDAEAAGKLPVLKGKEAEYSAVIESWRDQLPGYGVKFDGASQVKVDWESDGCPCRGYLDHLSVERLVIYDVKSCEDASDEATTKSIVSYGYDVQHAAYIEGVSVSLPELAGRVRFEFVFCETSPPFAINVRPLGGSMRELGERKWKRAKETWARCLEAGKFPGYEGHNPAEATPWQLSDEMERSMGKSEPPPF